MMLGIRLQWWMMRAKPYLVPAALLVALVLSACNSSGSSGSYGPRY